MIAASAPTAAQTAPASSASTPTPSTGVIGQTPAPCAGGQVGSGTRVGVLGNQGVFDTPSNIAGFTDQLVRDQQAQTLGDVLQNDPSVRVITPRGSFIDQFFIGGLPVTTADIAFDGVFGLTDQRRVLIEGVERVEVLKGASAFLRPVRPMPVHGPKRPQA